MKNGIEKFIQYQLDVQENFILEGVHLLPEHIADFYKRFPQLKDQIKVIFIVDSDQQNVLHGLQANTSPSDWLNGAKPQTYHAVAEFVARFSEYIEKDADKYQMTKYVKTKDFSLDVKRCLFLMV